MRKQNDSSNTNWEELTQFDYMQHSQLNALHMILREQENFLTTIKLKFKNEISSDPWLIDLSGRHYEGMYEFLYGFTEDVLNEFAQLQRYSSIVSIFSFLEKFLKEICEFVMDSFPGRFKFDDHIARQDPLTAYRNFLIQEYQIEFKEMESIFSKIKSEKPIRNKIVHHGGYLNKNEKHLIRVHKNLKLIDYDTKFKIVIEDNTYSLYLLDLISSFTSIIYNKIDKRYGIINKE